MCDMVRNTYGKCVHMIKNTVSDSVLWVKINEEAF